MQRQFNSYDEVRKASFLAASRIANVPLEEALSGSTKRGKEAQRLAILALRFGARLSIAAISRLLTVPITHVASADRIYRASKPGCGLRQKVAEVVAVMDDPKATPLESYTIDDSLFQLTSSHLGSLMSEMCWRMQELSDLMRRLEKAFYSIHDRSEAIRRLDRLIAAGWGDVPAEELPQEVLEAAASFDSPVPLRTPSSSESD